MLQRGRKNTSLAAVATLPGQRPEPPAELTLAQRKIWKAVVATKPADWFDSDTFPLLIAFCRHICTARLLSEQIDAVASLAGADRAALADYAALLKMRAAEVKSLVTVATSLRLTQQSRLKAETAATKHANNGHSGAGGKPWDVVN